MKRLIVVDVSSFIFRAFFAIRVLHAPDGTPVNAVHGVLNMLLKLFSVYRPTHVLFAKDLKGGSFRNELYSEYKANRSEPPEDLVPQFELITKLIEHMEVPSRGIQNYEADDIIGSAVVQFKDQFDEVMIASSDKDLMQFVGGNVVMVDTMKDKTYDADGVVEKMGVRPDQIVDYLSMVGDASDNIPGMRGIGAKGAAKLLAEHDTLEECIRVKDTFKGKKLTGAFENHLEDALLSKSLVEIVIDLDLGIAASETNYIFYPTDGLITYLKNLGFKSAIKKLEDIRYQVAQAEGNDDMDNFVNLSEAPVEFKVDVQVVGRDITFDAFTQLLDEKSLISLHSEYTSNERFNRSLKAIGICFDEDKSYYLPFENGLSEKELSIVLEKTWKNEKVEIYSSHLKRDIAHALELGFIFKAKHFDITQAHYVISASLRHEFSSMVMEYLDISTRELDKKNLFLEGLEAEDAQNYVGERALFTFKLVAFFKEELKKLELEQVYYDIDNTLFATLGKMEHEGIALNIPFFNEYEKELQIELDKLEEKIKSYSVEDINLNSPKQIAVFLFEELKLPPIKKTQKGGGHSTDAEVLVELDSRGLSEVPGLMLKHREVSKILSTYVKAIPQLVNSKTKRIHTSFNQHVAVTGRLASLNPNLQNIPIRTEMGRRVRKGFIASKGHMLLAADYSQVELRLLAHFSNDEVMIHAFNNDRDIHAETASEILGMALADVTSSDRSKAKAVNFGLMYGQSSFGLAKSLRISRKEAKEYITSYFTKFHKVKSFLDSLKEEAEEKGYAITMNGRKRFLPDIKSSNRNIKSGAERLAINSPIQGTAADIIKLAMIEIDKKMTKQKLKSKMLLQVHDELVFDVPESELEIMRNLVREGMENIVSLKVPLKVDMGEGMDWFDLK